MEDKETFVTAYVKYPDVMKIDCIGNRIFIFSITQTYNAIIYLLKCVSIYGTMIWSLFHIYSLTEGVPWDDSAAVELIKLITSSRQLKFSGLYTHEGIASYSVTGSENVQQVANTTVDRLLSVADK